MGNRALLDDLYSSVDKLVCLKAIADFYGCCFNWMLDGLTIKKPHLVIVGKDKAKRAKTKRILIKAIGGDMTIGTHKNMFSVFKSPEIANIKFVLSNTEDQ